MSIWWSLHLQREAASVPFARRLLLGAMEAAGVDPDVSFELSIALSEACANAVKHGGSEPAGGYRVTAYIQGDVCRIEVTDTGPGFPGGRRGRPRCGAPQAVLPAPSTAGQESGRGLFLIEALADHVRFRNRPGSGAVVTFDKVLKWREDALLRAG